MRVMGGLRGILKSRGWLYGIVCDLSRDTSMGGQSKEKGGSERHFLNE